MNVTEALAKVTEVPENSVLVAKPPLAWGSEAMFVQLTANDELPQSVQDEGYEYLLELEELEDALAFLKKKRVSERTKAEYVIHYALLDAAPAWIHDIPNT